MRIAIFIEQLFSTSTGEHRYLKNSLPELLRLGSGHQFTLFHSANFSEDDYPDWLRELPGNSRIQRVFPRRKSLMLNWIGGLIPTEHWIGEHDIFENPSTVPIYCRRSCPLVTIHDVATMELPAAHSRSVRTVSRLAWHLARVRKAAVLTVSQFTAGKVKACLGMDDSRVFVNYHGVDPAFRVIGPSTYTERFARLGLQNRFFLCVGALNRRKNTRRLLQAFASCRRAHDIEQDLVLAGPDMYGGNTLREWIAEMGLGEKVKYVGYLADADLVALMNCATALVFPSLYEGFGLPALEAMACGLPVICSANTGLDEIGGPAIRVNPVSVESIAAAMVRVASPQFDRGNLIEAGLNHARQFSWASSARRKLEIYDRIVRVAAEGEGYSSRFRAHT